ncbi:hypothetical protein BOX15_Mlig027258g1, partial [Macrostomum lignano]
FEDIEDMAGRPAAPTTIVEPADVLPAIELTELDLNHRELALLTDDTAVQWLARHGLLRNSIDCPNCATAMSYSGSATTTPADCDSLLTNNCGT